MIAAGRLFVSFYGKIRILAIGTHIGGIRARTALQITALLTATFYNIAAVINMFSVSEA